MQQYKGEALYFDSWKQQKIIKRMEEETSEEWLKTLNWPYLKTAGQGML